jgi:hypothetical protein
MKRRSSSSTEPSLLRDVAVAGMAVLLLWVVAGVAGLATGTLAPVEDGVLRFPVAVLVVMAPYAVLTEIRAQRLRRISPDERYGFVARSGGSSTE